MATPLNTASSILLGTTPATKVMLGTTQVWPALTPAVADSPYATALLTDEPVLYLPLNETSGTTAADASGWGRDAGYTGTYVSLGRYGITSGSTGRAVFNTDGGSTQHPVAITIPYDPWMDVTALTVTFCCYAPVSGIQMFASRYGDDATVGHDSWFASIGVSGTFEVWFQTQEGSSIRLDSGVVATDGVRYYVTAYIGASESSIRVYGEGGTLLGSATGAGGTLNSSSADLALFGSATDTGNYACRGFLDDFALYDRALTTARLDELAALALADNPPWIAATSAMAARNGTATHTLSFTAAQPGSLLVAVVASSTTLTAATSGWTKQLSHLGGTELAVFTCTATGGETSLDVSHSASNFPAAYAVYEFAAGSSYDSGATGATGEPPSLSGLPGTKVTLLLASSMDYTSTTTVRQQAWYYYMATSVDLYDPYDGATDGVGLNIATFAHNDYPDATASITDISLFNQSPYNGQSALFAIVHA